MAQPQRGGMYYSNAKGSNHSMVPASGESAPSYPFCDDPLAIETRQRTFSVCIPAGLVSHHHAIKPMIPGRCRRVHR